MASSLAGPKTTVMQMSMPGAGPGIGMKMIYIDPLFRCFDCDACDLERKGCGCSRRENDDGTLDDPGCFLCEPKLYARSPCVPRGDADALAQYNRQKSAYETLCVDLDKLLEAFGPDSSFVARLRELIADLAAARRPRRPSHLAMNLSFETTEALANHYEGVRDGDLAFVMQNRLTYAHHADGRAWLPVMGGLGVGVNAPATDGR